MKNAIHAALKGPELQKANIDGHEFNIKPVSYTIYNNEITVFGRLSHVLSMRIDDQVWYTFRKKGTVVNPSDSKKMVVKRIEGGAIPTIVKFKTGIVVIAALFTKKNVDPYFEALENQSGNLEFVDFDGDWENAVSSFLKQLAAAVISPNL